MDNLNFNLTEEQLNKIFPYHIIIGRDIQVRCFGSGIGKALQRLTAGTPFDEVFTLKNPGDLSDAILQDSLDKNILLESKTGGITLHGELLELPEGYLFAGS